MASPLNAGQQNALNDLLKDAVRDKNLARVKNCITRGAALDCSVFDQSFQGRYNYSRPLSVYAFEYYDRDVFEALAKAGLPLEAKDPEGKTALHRAVSDVRRGAVEHMLQLGANPLSEDREGTTILATARPATVGMRTDDREKIIDLLLNAMSPQRDDFNKAAAPAPSTAIADDVAVMKPITLSHKKDGGLNL